MEAVILQSPAYRSPARTDDDRLLRDGKRALASVSKGDGYRFLIDVNPDDFAFDPARDVRRFRFGSGYQEQTGNSEGKPAQQRSSRSACHDVLPLPKKG
jgi:hypothetical protein